MLRGLHRDMRTIILIQQRKLFIEIRTKESRASNRGGVAACVSKTTKCARFGGLVVLPSQVTVSDG